MFITIFQGIVDICAGLLLLVISVLPKSPFRAVTGFVADSNLLAALAWLVPFPQIIALLQAWGASIGIYYCWMVIARWIKLLG